MIITNNEDLLRVECHPVELGEVDNLRKKLEEALVWSASRGFPGVGLACPQIGISKSMAIVRVHGHVLDLINAEIVEKHDEFEFEGEGCLSFPGRYERTLRYREIVVQNNLIFPKSFIANGFVSIVVQHELDHLKKTLLPDVALPK